MFKQFDTVKTLADLPEVGIAAGSIGTIVEVYSTPHSAYEVEFCNGEGETLAMIALKAEQFTLDTPARHSA